RLLDAVQEYQRRLEAGEGPSRQELLKRYPDLVEPLAECLDGLELVHKAVQPSTTGRAEFGPAPRDELPANPLGDLQVGRQAGRGDRASSRPDQRGRITKSGCHRPQDSPDTIRCAVGERGASPGESRTYRNGVAAVDRAFDSALRPAGRVFSHGRPIDDPGRR